MKKKYIQPEMLVGKIHARMSLLTGSLPQSPELEEESATVDEYGFYNNQL